jgi:hypothetical protein
VTGKYDLGDLHLPQGSSPNGKTNVVVGAGLGLCLELEHRRRIEVEITKNVCEK